LDIVPSVRLVKRSPDKRWTNIYFYLYLLSPFLF
jgi:hypothetical protein